MLEMLQQLIRDNSPKSIGGAIKRNKILHRWMIDNTSNLLEPVSLSERAYTIINQINSNVCTISNKSKIFKSILLGYGFCGPAGICECARKSVSKKVSDTKQLKSDEENKEINSKREQTNLERYKVANSGQTDTAKDAHIAFYSDQQNIDTQLKKQGETILLKYGVENVATLDFIKEKKKKTNLDRYGVENPMKLASIVDKMIETKQRLYEPHYLAKNNHNRFIQMIRENFDLDALIIRDDYIGMQCRPLIQFKCISCDNTFEKRFDYASPPKCRICNPTDVSYKSKEELNLLEFVKGVIPNLTVISGDRSIINPYEIDIYIPDLNIGIEYCGLYWHSEISNKKNWNYHFRKWQSASKKGIQLITIFSDEWLSKRSIVEKIIRNKISSESSLIYARKCSIKIVSNKIAKNFYDNNHLIGSPKKLPINIALIYNDKILSIMSFIRKRNQEYELIRFASIGRIPGGASKLLRYFINQYNPNAITSFSDNRYSDGNLYQVLGFSQISKVPPMQSYVKNYLSRFHKLSLGKKALIKLHPNIDLTKTEWEILQELKYDRIWDCGKIKWELNL